MEALIELRNCEKIKWEEKEEKTKKERRKAGDPFHMFKTEHRVLFIAAEWKH